MPKKPPTRTKEETKKYVKFVTTLRKLDAVTPSKEPEDFKPGIFRHYKGDLYRALMLVHHHETREYMVVYVSLAHGSINVREYATPGRDSWTDVVNVGDSSDTGEYVPVARFTYVRPG